MKPFGRRVHIKPEEQDSIILTENSRNIVRGNVRAVGDEVKKIKVGDNIVFTTWGIDEVNLNDEKHYFLIESDEFILAVERKSVRARKVT